MIVVKPAEEHDFRRGERIHHAVELLVARAITKRDLVLVISGVKEKGGVHLAQIAQTGRAAGDFAGFGQSGEKNGDQDGDDADDDEQLDECKAARSFGLRLPHRLRLHLNRWRSLWKCS